MWIKYEIVKQQRWQRQWRQRRRWSTTTTPTTTTTTTTTTTMTWLQKSSANKTIQEIVTLATKSLHCYRTDTACVTCFSRDDRHDEIRLKNNHSYYRKKRRVTRYVTWFRYPNPTCDTLVFDPSITYVTRRMYSTCYVHILLLIYISVYSTVLAIQVKNKQAQERRVKM